MTRTRLPRTRGREFLSVLGQAAGADIVARRDERVDECLGLLGDLLRRSGEDRLHLLGGRQARLLVELDRHGAVLRELGVHRPGEFVVALTAGW